MVHRLEEILENDLEEYTYQEDYDVTAIRGNTVKPEREDDVGTTPSIVKHISFHYSNFLKLRHFATKNKTHKKIMATICRGFRRRRQRQRRRQVYFKSSTDSGSVRSTLLAARTILERTTEVGRHRLSSIRHQSDKIKRTRKHGFADANKKKDLIDQMMNYLAKNLLIGSMQLCLENISRSLIKKSAFKLTLIKKSAFKIGV